MPRTTRIDSHVHLYSSTDLARVASALPYALPAPHPLADYLDRLLDAGIAPVVVNNVHLSILPDSENVFESFSELARLQQLDPVRYANIQLVGTIKADPSYATANRLAHPQVVGVRLVLHDARPESVADDLYRGSAWEALFDRLQPRQHVHLYAQEAETNLRVLRQLPQNCRVVIDHLGSCHGSRGADEPSYVALLAEANRRGNVWFKGPGYRTSLDPQVTASFATQIVRQVGADKLLLDATDAPHVGQAPDGTAYANVLNPLVTYAFVDTVARWVSADTHLPADQLLRGAWTQLAG